MSHPHTTGSAGTGTNQSRPSSALEGCTRDKKAESRLDPLKGALAWEASDFSDPSRYTVELDRDELADITNGLETFLRSGLDPNDISPSTFPLSRAQEKLHRCAQILHNGHGFCVVRGLGSEHPVEQGLLIFLGLASHIGDKRGVQNKQGHMLSHITDLRPRKKQEDEVRHGIHTNSLLPFHTDMGTDVLALQVRGLAAQGGHTFVSSAWSIYNDLLSEPNHNHLRTLLEPTWPIQISKRQARTACLVRSLLTPDWPPMPCRYILAPLFELSDGRLMVSVDPARLGPQKAGSEDAPPLTSAQLAALDALQRSAERHQVRIHTAPGDIMFINNWALLHRRDSYLDSPQEKRHLVRLWLRNSDLGWPVPDTMAVPWHSAFGIDVPDRFYPVEPLDIYPEPKYSVGSAAFVLDDTDEENGE
ncbi:hypothetical protein ACRALDRAFT_1056444 [Sodiomyces alcalophilus JCM 7366]|uniref:uncharacterized protein n=1 Tax=Sodiomyces alcalophilus JCM 7366 TaxID=591952 RepID=UPI0039B4A84D